MGASAIPMLLNNFPYQPNLNLVPAEGESGLPIPIPGSASMLPASFGYYYQHSFASLTLQGSNATVDYYNIDWNCWIASGCKWSQPVKTWSESF